MRRFKRLFAVAIPLASLISVLAPTPAQASTVVTGDGVVTGSGNISPGLNPPPASTPQSVTFGGRVTGALTVTSVTPQLVGTVVYDVTCTFGGASKPTTGENSLEGTGNVQGTCFGTGVFNGVVGTTPVTGPGTVRVNCSLNYHRITGVVVVTGPCSATATVGTTTASVSFCVVGEFVFVPATATPTTAYTLAGSVTATPPQNKGGCATKL